MRTLCTILLAVLSVSTAGSEVVLYLPTSAARREALSPLAEKLRDRGLSPIWRDTALLKPDPARIHLVLAASTLPRSAHDEVVTALHGTGRWIFLGAPAFTDPVMSWEGSVRRRSEILKEIAATKPTHVATTPDTTAAWRRSTNTPDRPFHVEVVETEKGPSLHAVVGDLNGWDTLLYQGTIRIPAGHNVTTFWARGDAATTALSIEWREQDGSRWIATVPLETKWRRYVLSEQDFTFWISRPDRADSRLVLPRAAGLSVGVAFSHTGSRTGRHEYWITAIGTARREVPGGLFATPRPIGGLCPAYKFFETEAHQLTTGKALGVASFKRSFEKPQATVGLHPRPAGRGLEKGRPFRFAPILECSGPEKDYRGAPAVVFVGSAKPYLGSVWASFTHTAEEIAADPTLLNLVAGTAEAMSRGTFFLNAGTDRFTYFAGKTAIAGADVINSGTAAAAVVCEFHIQRVKVAGEGRTGEEHILRRREARILEAGEIWRPRAAFSTDELGDVNRFEALLRGKGSSRTVDALSQDIHCLRFSGAPSFVSVKNRHFTRRGCRWRPHGVNYMPSSGIGLEDWQRFERWLSGPSYDPEIVRRDLRRLKRIGLDAVSVFLYAEAHEAGNLVDLLHACRTLDLAVNLSLRPGTPVRYTWDDWRRMIVENRIPENDTVFAYDIAWEPSFHTVGQRRRFDRAWAAWIADRYGSIEKAEKAWGYPLPREKGRVVSPTGRQLWNEGPWRVMVCAYRRFMDDNLGKFYRVALRRIKDVDPHHLVSYRMTVAGDPTYRNEGAMPYAFMGSARTMDFLAPEAYGRIGTWEGSVRPGIFTVAYGRAVAPHAPVTWAEIGMNIWNRAAGRTDAAGAVRQAQYFKDFYRLLRLSDSDGVFFWWYPGGFRVGENSDYGIINPDGTWRPATKVIHRFSREGWGGPAKAGRLITVDRDAHASGLWGVWQEAKDRFLAEVEAGSLPRVSLWSAGMTSASAPPLAIGNVPLPAGVVPKYLNGFWEKVRVERPDGTTIDCTFGGNVTAKPGTPLVVRAWAFNTGPATWLSEGPRGVDVVLTGDTGAERTAPYLKNVTYLTAAETVIALPSAEAVWYLGIRRRDGLRFGERVRIEIRAERMR